MLPNTLDTTRASSNLLDMKIKALLRVREIESGGLITPLSVIPSMVCVWFVSNSLLQKLSLTICDPPVLTSLSYRIEGVGHYERRNPTVTKIISSTSPTAAPLLLLSDGGIICSSIGAALQIPPATFVH